MSIIRSKSCHICSTRCLLGQELPYLFYKVSISRSKSCHILSTRCLLGQELLYLFYKVSIIRSKSCYILSTRCLLGQELLHLFYKVSVRSKSRHTCSTRCLLDLHAVIPKSQLSYTIYCMDNELYKVLKDLTIDTIAEKNYILDYIRLLALYV